MMLMRERKVKTGWWYTAKSQHASAKMSIRNSRVETYNGDESVVRCKRLGETRYEELHDDLVGVEGVDKERRLVSVACTVSKGKLSIKEEENIHTTLMSGLCDANGSTLDCGRGDKTPANVTHRQSEPDRLSISSTAPKLVQSHICKPIE